MIERYVRMKPLKTLINENIIELIHVSDSGEYIRYKVLPDGPEINQWQTGDEPLLVVNCGTLHESMLKTFPQLYEDVKDE